MHWPAQTASQSSATLALTEDARTITETHLRKTAPSDIRVKHALHTILESEADFVEADDADEQLLTLLGRPSAPSVTKRAKTGEEQKSASCTPNKPQVGRRAPGRDPIGSESEEEALNPQIDEVQEAG